MAKEEELKKSEGKKVVIATYAMAEEGLDIKTLTTLIMATPKVDVTQSVGRILRKKHKQAIVVDIVDSHSLFQRHFAKRKTFYRKSKFKIEETDMEGYEKVSNIEVIACCDTVPNAVKYYQNEFNIPQGFTDIDEMLTVAKPEIVSVCVWHLLHDEITIKLSESSHVKGIICEKPMAINSFDCG